MCSNIYQVSPLEKGLSKGDSLILKLRIIQILNMLAEKGV